MTENERSIREWSKMHNVPYVRSLIEILDRERTSHADDIRELLGCRKREETLIKKLDRSWCPKCRKEPKSK